MEPSTERRSFRLLVLALIAAFALVLAGCGSSDGDAGSGDADSSTTAAEEDGGTTTLGDDTSDDGSTTTAAPDPADGGGDLDGSWVADAGDIMGVNTANLGGVTFECSGPITLTFDGGSFTQAGESTCTVAGQTATATFNSSGDYSVSGSTLTTTNAVNEGTMVIAGMTQPFEGGVSNGSAEYAIDGDQLSITFTNETVGTVTQVFTRA